MEADVWRYIERRRSCMRDNATRKGRVDLAAEDGHFILSTRIMRDRGPANAYVLLARTALALCLARCCCCGPFSSRRRARKDDANNDGRGNDKGPAPYRNAQLAGATALLMDNIAVLARVRRALPASSHYKFLTANLILADTLRAATAVLRSCRAADTACEEKEKEEEASSIASIADRLTVDTSSPSSSIAAQHLCLAIDAVIHRLAVAAPAVEGIPPPHGRGNATAAADAAAVLDSALKRCLFFLV